MSSVATLTELTPAQRRELLKMARARDLVGDRSELPHIERAPRDERLPVSFAQERLWLIDRLEPGSAVYNIPVAWRLGGALDEAALERALGEIVRRHETLRTVFAEADGSPVQVITPFAGFALPVEDLTGLDEAAVRRRAGEEALRPFDLSAGPLFRASLLRLGTEEHVLLLSMHHIVSDGWSMGVLYRELSALYQAYREGRESPLTELAVQYADYAVWQREQLKGEVLERHLSYWRERLAGAPELLELPTDRPRPPVQTYRGATVSVDLSLELLERLQALGRSEGATLNMVLLGAFQVLLSKYSGSEDIVVGSPAAGRTRKEVEELIGFFVNTLVLRTDLSGDPGFREVLRRAREVTLGAYKHQEVPFERLVAELQPERSLSHTPLFHVMFALQNAVDGGVALPGLEVSEAGAELATAKFDLSLMARATAQGLRFRLNYSTDLFERGTIERMLSHLARVLEQVAADADVRLSQLDLLGDAEREQVLEAWNQTKRGYAALPVHALFAEWARRAPQAVALLDGREAVTYGALDRRASLLARHLRDLGVGAETPVGLCMERTPELLVGVLGIWKAGGAYVPLDPGYPAERLGWIITDAAVPVVVATGSTAAVLPEHGATLVRVDQLPAMASDAVAEMAPELPASAASLAYVIYTSGSTGRPKGVLVQHGSLSNLLAAARETFGVREGDVMPALASYAFDIWLFEALLPLTSGAAVRLVERERVLDVPALLEEIADATLVHAVPALMRQVVQAERETPRLARLRRAFVGGDRVPADLLAEIRETFSGAETHVLYGPTEGTILASTHPVPEDGIVAGHPIGAPLWNVRLYVCDALGSPQPVGIPGELLIGGAGVARGYLGRPELTAERFVPDPFSSEPGARLYRTGDRARWRPDGTLEFLGRLDGQVKIRGFRIEPGEVEAVLRQHEGVAECAVVVRQDDDRDPRLAAYVVPVPRKDVELWPSIGEYFVYDDLIYHGLTNDTGRNDRYLRALRRHAPGKVVLDVGTGADAILARLAVEAGARHVYAVELLERSYLSARERVRKLGLEDRITVIRGDARTVELPELADVCVSEIVESIAGGEGGAVILNHVRRLLAPGAVMIPEWARTRVAAVTLPDELRHEIGFSPTAAHYVKGIFEEVGYPFDLRLCIRNFPADHVLSTVGTYEELDFRAGPVDAEYVRREELVIEREGTMDGLLLWLRMSLAEGEVLDIVEQETAWFPVYFPLFEPAVQVTAGDRLHLECWAAIPEGVAPDYGVRGRLMRGGDGEEVPFEFVSCHHSPAFRASPFYRRLFADGEIPTLHGQGDALTESLREHLQRSLPEYMVPAAFMVLERLPLTPNGKVDRKALPAPEHGAHADRYVAPRTPVEEVLAGIWAEVLRVERVGVTESFFALGGHSLLAARVISRIRDVFAVELPLRALFEGPTVAGLAGRVEEVRRAELPVLPPVVPAERTGALPPSFAQERLWFIDRMEPGSTTYNMPVARRLGGALDEAALERALGEIVRRHDSLRTVFAEVDGSPVQVIAPFDGFALPVEDVSGLGEADREAAVKQHAREEAARPFDLSAGPLFRAALLRLGEQDHVLLLSMHHIVSDGWSMGVLFRELSALYEAYREGRESPLTELAVQYADYAVWQREQLAGEVLERQLGYWRERLADAPELLELPTDHPRPAVQTFRGAHERIELSLELLERLRALGRSEGATLYMVVLSAFQVLLSRYSGSEDVVVGSPIAGRTRREVEELIGFFVNTLVLRTDISGDPGFRELLGRVREVTLGAYEHQEMPFERLVAELRPERSLSHAPLFQVVFTLNDAQDTGGGLAGLSVQGVGTELEVAKFDLSLGLAVGSDGLRGGLTYSTDLFERGTIRRMLGHLERVLEQAAADPDVRISQVTLLDEAERRQVVEEWNRTDAEYPAGVCIHELVAAQAERTPDAVAVASGVDAITYAMLDHAANRLSNHLRRRGVRPETRVGICLERGPELVVAILAVLKAGGAYMPLDPAYPAERLAFMLADSGAPLLLTRLPLPEGLHAAEVVCLDVDRERIEAESAQAPAAGVLPASLAYVIYTSGSTGRPKGVLVQHGSLSNLLAATRQEFGVREGDVMPALASYAFDIWLFEALLPLTSGAAVRLVERERVLDVAALVEEIADATLVHAVPALMRQVVQVERETPRLRRLRRAFVGGDRVPADLLAEMRQTLPAAETHVLYGPTEGTILASVHSIPGDGIVAGHPIGAPLGNVRLYVCDALANPQPAGVPGELMIGGAGVARGYLGRPELTAERFVPDPFGGESGARLYRTGDRARWRTDGTLEFLGRVDGQVKVRGFRIEPGEIEAVLRRHAEVREARVIVREDAPGEHRLVAYVVGGVEAEELRGHVRKSVPEYMVPAAFVYLDALPLTPNGKLDRKALPAPEYASAEDRHVAPSTPVEEVLAGIWAEVLGLERVGVEENFFEVGGHSLLATRVVSRIREVFGVELPLRALFEGPTVQEMAVRVEEIRRAELPVLPPVVPTARTGPLPLSFAQERLWFIDRLDPGSTTYNMSLAWRLDGALDERALERSLSEIVRRHEALRTVFREASGSPVQVVAPFGGFTLRVDDLSGLGEGEREAGMRRRVTDEAVRPFDLATGPLFRAALLRLGGEDHVLLLSMHHIVSDGWSMGVFSRELSSLYEAYRKGGESPLPELAVQYADYAVWQREQLAGEVLDRQLAYWRERLADAPALLELPTDHPHPAVQTFRGATVPVELSLELLERLQALGRSEGATLYMTLLGAFQVLLAKYSGSEDIVVGSPIAGRTRKEVEELIGFFVNTLVLRTGLGGDPTLREVLGRVREVTLGAYEHQEVPFERLVAELQPERSLSHSPLFQVMFALQDTEGGGSALPGLEVSGVGANLASAKFDLSLNLSATAKGLRGGLNYSTDVFERGTIERMVRHLERVLEQVALDPEVRLSRLELLTAGEREQVLTTWNQTERGYSALPVHEMFAEWARRAPEAVALLDGHGSVTYGALDRRASILARHLRGLGVGPETPVGLCMERTPELLVGVLGIWKAGGAYVPLDPDYPAERLGWMITDAALPVVVATEGTAAVLPEHGATLVRVDQLPETAEAAAEMAPEVPPSDASLAYVIYTSGSTGRPKGVLVPHGSLSNLLAATREVFGVGAGDVMPALASYAFDIWLSEALLPLTSGGAVRLVARERVLDVAALLEEIADATLLHAVPALMRQVVQAERETPRLRRLRRAFVGGDRVPADLLAEMRATFPGAETHVLYGPTEGTILASTHPVPADARVEGHPIGNPLGNVHLYVCDALGSPQPVGVPGELLIGGAGVARGYLGRPELTAERFVPDPFSSEPGARLYRTGDRARWRADGTLEFLGRLDGQVKIRGFRIEPGEIEAVLSAHDAVREARVIVRENQPGETRLVAYVVGVVQAEELREHLRKSVPEYMVPAAFVVLERLPLTPNGKLDLKALPAPELVPGESGYVAPRRPLEAALAEIWAEVLGRARVGVKENFFDLGGHSLLLVKVQTRLGETLGRKIPIVDLFRFPTVAALAEHLGAGVEGAAGPQAEAEGRRRRGRDRAAVRRALAGQGAGGSGGATHNGEDR
jgi:amino acid adenylation domain-containing protein